MESSVEQEIRNTRAEDLFVEEIEMVFDDADTPRTTWTRLASITIYAMLETLTPPARTAVVHQSFIMLFLT